eukprot:TRINITY_DN2947_c0_g1_i2.p1 TRINITY_DN2947_c0_g1~~TRINITY_DN2947_c0_g1_i2.p1  ORF type:complete len:192 (+),score=36.05 TRINITY_DN2947_c0_g1_i2:715-1290(+)
MSTTQIGQSPLRTAHDPSKASPSKAHRRRRRHARESSEADDEAMSLRHRASMGNLGVSPARPLARESSEDDSIDDPTVPLVWNTPLDSIPFSDEEDGDDDESDSDMSATDVLATLPRLGRSSKTSDKVNLVVPRALADALPTLLATIGDVAIKDAEDEEEEESLTTPRYARKSKRKIAKGRGDNAGGGGGQ